MDISEKSLERKKDKPTSKSNTLSKWIVGRCVEGFEGVVFLVIDFVLSALSVRRTVETTVELNRKMLLHNH